MEQQPPLRHKIKSLLQRRKLLIFVQVNLRPFPIDDKAAGFFGSSKAKQFFRPSDYRTKTSTPLACTVSSEAMRNTSVAARMVSFRTG